MAKCNLRSGEGDGEHRAFSGADARTINAGARVEWTDQSSEIFWTTNFRQCSDGECRRSDRCLVGTLDQDLDAEIVTPTAVPFLLATCVERARLRSSHWPTPSLNRPLAAFGVDRLAFAVAAFASDQQSRRWRQRWLFDGTHPVLPQRQAVDQHGGFTRNDSCRFKTRGGADFTRQCGVCRLRFDGHGFGGGGGTIGEDHRHGRNGQFG